MVAFDVDRWHLEFGPRWSFACGWDTEPIYRERITKLQGTWSEVRDGKVVERIESTRAVDVLGILDGRLCFVELKDYRRIVRPDGIVPNAIAYGSRLDSLPLLVALKVRDSLAGFVGASTNDRIPQRRAEMTAALHRSVLVVACVALAPRRAESHGRRDVRLGELRKRLEGKLSCWTHGRPAPDSTSPRRVSRIAADDWCSSSSLAALHLAQFAVDPIVVRVTLR